MNVRKPTGLQRPQLGYWADFGMDTISLAGTLEAKLAAVKAAGFSQIMLAARDIVGHPLGLETAVAIVRESGLRVTGFQVLRDFEGLNTPDTQRLHAYKMDIAKAMLDMCAALGSRVLLVCSSTSIHASQTPSVLAADLRKLAMLAVPKGIRVAYEGLSWGRSVNEFTQAFTCLRPIRLSQRSIPSMQKKFSSCNSRTSCGNTRQRLQSASRQRGTFGCFLGRAYIAAL
jgi:hypothetical protein